MKLSTKLFLLVQIPAGVLLLVFGFFVTSQTAKLGRYSGEIMQNNFRSVLAAQRMNEAIERMDSAALARLSGQWDQFQTVAEHSGSVFENELRTQEENVTENEEKSSTDSIRNDWNRYRAEYETFRNDEAKAEKEFYRNTLFPLFTKIKKETDRVLALNQDAMLRKSKTLESLAAAQVRTMIVVSAVLILLFLFLSGWQIRRLLRPLTVLSQAVRRVGKGDWVIRVLDKGNDEIAHLAKEFNQMTEHLAEYRNSSLGDLLQAKQMSQAAIDSLTDPVLIYGIRGELINMNSSSENRLGISHGNPVETNLPEDFRGKLESIRKFVLGGRGEYVPKGYTEAIRYRKTDGGDFRFLLRGHPLYGERGEIIGVTILCQDITKLYEIYSLKTDIVSTAVKELKEPLLSLETALYVCMEGEAGELNEKQADLMFAARRDCQKLKDNLEELLDLSRIQSDRGIE